MIPPVHGGSIKHARGTHTRHLKRNFVHMFSHLATFTKSAHPGLQLCLGRTNFVCVCVWLNIHEHMNDVSTSRHWRRVVKFIILYTRLHHSYDNQLIVACIVLMIASCLAMPTHDSPRLPLVEFANSVTASVVPRFCRWPVSSYCPIHSTWIWSPSLRVAVGLAVWLARQRSRQPLFEQTWTHPGFPRLLDPLKGAAAGVRECHV